MLLADVVEASRAVGATRSRRAKVDILAAALRAAAEPEGANVDLGFDLGSGRLAIAIAFLCGEPRQGRIGVGWAAVSAIKGAEADQPELSLEAVDSRLATIAGTHGPGSGEVRAAALAELFAMATAAERVFLVRLLAGELRQGALEALVAEAVARATDVDIEAVRRAWMLTGALGSVAVLARHGGIGALAGVALEVGRPVRPMLAVTSASVVDAMTGEGPFRIEWKLDGARIQAHRNGDQVWLFTRNLNDVTHRLPSVVEVLQALPVQSVILDGEVLGWGLEDRPERFQETMAEFSSFAPSNGVALRPFFFDILHLDGRDLLDQPLVERIDALARIAPGRYVPGLSTSDAVAAQRFADDAMARGHEGVMVKTPLSRYEAGRRGAPWRKVKPVRTLDLVVLAAEWGHGRRHGWLSNLHLGALGADDTFVMVGKTFKGLTDSVLQWQTEALLAREYSRSGITVKVRAELVVEIAVDGVQASSRYSGGVALRFARVKRYRDDKTVAEADSIDNVRALLAR